MDVFSTLTLAQTSEVASGWVSVLQTVVQGGAALVLAVVLSILGYAHWKLMDRSHAQEKDRLNDANTSATARLLEQEKLLREQISREREAQETVTAAVQAIEGFAHTLREQKASCDATKQAVEVLSGKLNDVVGRLRDLEDIVRRTHRDT